MYISKELMKKKMTHGWMDGWMDDKTDRFWEIKVNKNKYLPLAD